MLSISASKSLKNKARNQKGTIPQIYGFKFKTYISAYRRKYEMLSALNLMIKFWSISTFLFSEVSMENNSKHSCLFNNFFGTTLISAYHHWIADCMECTSESSEKNPPSLYCSIEKLLFCQNAEYGIPHPRSFFNA